MAKKTAKKAAGKTSKASKVAAKPAKKVAKKAPKAASAKASSPAGAGGGKAGPFPVTTGKGATPAQIGADLVAMFNRGEFEAIENKYWSPDIESIEGLGVNMGWRGRKAVDEKNAGWMSDRQIHGASADGPFVGSSAFAVRFRMDVETKSTGQRETMDEVGVYTVRDGKIVREEFMYLAPG